MTDNRPIIIIEDDDDDQELLKEVFAELGITNLIRFFSTCMLAIDYLLTTVEKPFLIISDINLPAMTGMELKQEINNNPVLQRKSIPFVFLTTNPENKIIQLSYQLLAQGYFVKPTTMKDLKEMLGKIIEYWRVCRFPIV